MASSGPTLARLLARGHQVAVDNGHLVIVAASDRDIPPGWIGEHQHRLIADAARLVRVLALEYVGYSTGSYIVDQKSQRRADGVTLQFRCLVSDQEFHAIFNACARRQRTSQHGKAGSPLPKGRFNVGERSNFFKFWKSTGLSYRRLSEFHDYMGNLSGQIYTAAVSDGERLESATLRPLTLSHAVLLQADNSPIRSRQMPDNIPTRFPDKEMPQTQQWRDFPRNPTTGLENHGNTVIRECGYTGSYIPPELQTTEQWLAELDATPSPGK